MNQENAIALLEGIRAMQYTVYTFEEFVRVLKKRVMRWTGDTAVMFFNEIALVIELARLGVLQQLSQMTEVK